MLCLICVGLSRYFQFLPETDLRVPPIRVSYVIDEYADSPKHISELRKSFNEHQLFARMHHMTSGSLLQIVDDVVGGKSRSGICVVRAPSHPQGFCIVNNVGVAAQYAIRDRGVKRVLIVDWDENDGNGTQTMFAENPEVLYVSLKRQNGGTPSGIVGSGKGAGFTVNIPWDRVRSDFWDWFSIVY